MLRITLNTILLDGNVDRTENDGQPQEAAVRFLSNNNQPSFRILNHESIRSAYAVETTPIAVENTDPNTMTFPVDDNEFIGLLSTKHSMLVIREHAVLIGRTVPNSLVDFQVPKNNYVSRKHCVLRYENGEFTIECLSKNGLYVDGLLLRKGYMPYKLSRISCFRFPSTDIEVVFENLIKTKQNSMMMAHTSPTAGDANGSVEQGYESVPTTTMYETSHDSGVHLSSTILPLQEPAGQETAEHNFRTPTPAQQEHFPATVKPQFNAVDTVNSVNNLLAWQPPETYVKPPYSYAQLIIQAIMASPDKQLPLSEIYGYIAETYPFYRHSANWQNSIRHNLSLNRYFIKVPRANQSGKGSYWRIDPQQEPLLAARSHRMRRNRAQSVCLPRPCTAFDAPAAQSSTTGFRSGSPEMELFLRSAPITPESINGIDMRNMRPTHFPPHEESFDYEPVSKRHKKFLHEF
uniref:Fork-head domain-containing protein n=1 Tax=Anopheles dirus TaxID=7168 RepID=A0A182NJI9_9DIPT